MQDPCEVSLHQVRKLQIVTKIPRSKKVGGGREREEIPATLREGENGRDEERKIEKLFPRIECS